MTTKNGDNETIIAARTRILESRLVALLGLPSCTRILNMKPDREGYFNVILEGVGQEFDFDFPGDDVPFTPLSELQAQARGR